jgi:hypothetical protein
MNKNLRDDEKGEWPLNKLVQELGNEAEIRMWLRKGHSLEKKDHTGTPVHSAN